jgi:hypothetical protein
MWQEHFKNLKNHINGDPMIKYSFLFVLLQFNEILHTKVFL